MKALSRLALLGLPLLLAGCAALTALDDASQPLAIYELQTPAVQPVASRRSVEVVIEEPVASGALATERIMVRPGPLRAEYLPGVRWADPAPVMLQTLMVRGLTQTGAVGSVGRRPVGTLSDYAVLSELTDFQAEVDPEGPSAVVRVRLILRVVRERDARVVATRAFAALEPATSTDPEVVAAAFDRATSELMTAAVAWVAAQAR